MNSYAVVVGLVLGIGSAAQAAGRTFLELVPNTPGPYEAGAAIDVDVLLHNNEGAGFNIRLAQLDVAASDAALDIADFGIDLSSLLDDALYAQFPTDIGNGNTIANATFISTVHHGFILHIGDAASLAIARLSVTLPDAPGSYSLDVINTGASDTNSGARFDYGFDVRTILHAMNGNLSGGVLNLQVIPEPATLVLLGLGGAAVAFQDRRSRRRSRRGGQTAGNLRCD